MIKLLNDFNVAKNFKVSEFVCPDGSSEVMIVNDMINKIQILRDLAKAPVIIVSGFRNPAYNKSIGGYITSMHLAGRAYDIHVTGYRPEQIVTLAQQAGFTSIIVYDTWVHVSNKTPKAFSDERVQNKGKYINRLW